MSSFGKRITELRKSKKLTQKELAAIFKVTERAYQNYEYDKRHPEFENLLFIADYFNVSLDYLVGRSDDPTIH